MAFEVYRPRSTSENIVAITKHHIRLGTKIAGLLKGDQVEIAYDKETNKLRIRSVDEAGMKVTKNKIGAKGVLNYFDLNVAKGNYAAEFNPEEIAVYVDLNTRK
ncbi:hypothetical protein SPSYN_01843 [Sporotomaculum syntrophicum]|uniref:Uncharacterized protein n=1 Tax=Sporotomaculum syntrophicum TaxID=182264 RepID=A0A9D2WQD0_9FIRM|nr:hypothetical protein [Sporotomaculum syntrophicum]KAF1085697.1 hypothetical protein SPSYN_01843 [Sporotomaculum syntrophicum]